MDFLTMSDEDKRRAVQAQPFLYARFEEAQSSAGGVVLQLTLDPRQAGAREALEAAVVELKLNAKDQEQFQSAIQIEQQAGPILARYEGL